MASSIADRVHAVGDAISAAGSNKKVADLTRDTKDAHSKQTATTDYGIKVHDLDHWLRVAGQEHVGASLLEDQIARERIHRFDHERIPERVVHARGAAAHGVFKITQSAEDVTFAKVLTDTSRETPVFVRFSTVQGSRGSADTVRDVRGFAVKLYTEEGNWDLVGNDIPVFFIQDAIKFTDLVHAVKPEPHNEVPQGQSAHNNFWDFVYMHSEATHMYFWAMSDRGIPRSYRMMQGFGVNTYTLINAKGERHFVKFHWLPELGVHSFMWDEALKICGQDPDFHRKDLEEAINNGAPAKWKFGIQTIPESKQHDFDFDILDATKIWPEDLVPVRYIGELTLNRTVDEYFTETEQVAFCTSHIVPGIDFSDDPLLQGRNFSYFDTQISRLGINWEELPINRPVCPVMNFNRDGQGRHTITKGKVNYWPNRLEATPPANHRGDKGGFQSYPAPEVGIKARKLGPKWKDHTSQAQLFYNSLTPIEKLHLTKAFAFELDHCDEPIVYNRLVERLTEIDLELAQQVAEMVGAPTPNKQTRTNPGQKVKGVSQVDVNTRGTQPTIKSRRIAILIADGYDAGSYEGLRAAIKAAGALPFTIGPRRQPIRAADGKGEAKPDHHLDGMRSTLFDAIFVPGGTASAETLAKMGLARFWVREAFGHCKAIGAVGAGVKLVEAAVKEVGDGKYELSGIGGKTGVLDWYGVITSAELSDHEISSVKETIQIIKDGKGLIEKFFWQISQHRNWDRQLDGLTDMVSV